MQSMHCSPIYVFVISVHTTSQHTNTCTCTLTREHLWSIFVIKLTKQSLNMYSNLSHQFFSQIKQYKQSLSLSTWTQISLIIFFSYHLSNRTLSTFFFIAILNYYCTSIIITFLFLGRNFRRTWNEIKKMQVCWAMKEQLLSNKSDKYFLWDANIKSR